MKKKILSIVLGLVSMAIVTTTYASDKTPVSNTKPTAVEKAMKNFNGQFKNSVNPVIYSSIGGFIVQSQADGHKVTSAYNKNGSWVYSIKQYSHENLAKNILDIVKDSYSNYFISTMEKIDQPGDKSVYVVHIQDSNTFKTVRVSREGVELVQDFKRHKASIG